jgi:hypothetical protein
VKAVLRLRSVLPSIDGDRALALLGETIREIGVLTIVFVPLDAVFAPSPVQTLAVTVAILLGTICLVGGYNSASKLLDHGVSRTLASRLRGRSSSRSDRCAPDRRPEGR